MKIVLVEWRAVSIGRGWVDNDVLMEATKEKFVYTSVGWLMNENEDSILIVPHRNKNQGSGNTTIPKSCVVSMKTLRSR